MIPRHLQITVVVLLVGTFALGFYVLREKRNAETGPRRADTRPVAAPVSGTSEAITFYIAYDDAGVLRPKNVNLPLPPQPSDRAREVLRALISEYLENPSPHPLGVGSDVKDVYLLEDGSAVVDTTAAFAGAHRSGALVEQLTVFSLVETLAANVSGIRRVKFLVDGKERETLAGHADLLSPYDVSAVAHAAQDMQ